MLLNDYINDEYLLTYTYTYSNSYTSTSSVVVVKFNNFNIEYNNYNINSSYLLICINNSITFSF